MSVREPEIHFTREAEDDYKSISLYTWQNWSEDQATIYESLIEKSLDLIREHPRVGRQQEDLFAGCRSIRVEQHIIYYDQPSSSKIVVVRILHHRQDARAVVEAPRQ